MAAAPDIPNVSTQTFNSTTTSFTSSSVTIGAADNAVVLALEAYTDNSSQFSSVVWNGTGTFVRLGGVQNADLTWTDYWVLVAGMTGFTAGASGTVVVTYPASLPGFSYITWVPLSGVNLVTLPTTGNGGSGFGTIATNTNSTGAPISVTGTGTTSPNDIYLGLGQFNTTSISQTNGSGTNLGKSTTAPVQSASTDYMPGNASGVFTWTGSGGSDNNANAIAMAIFGAGVVVSDGEVMQPRSRLGMRPGTPVSSLRAPPSQTTYIPPNSFGDDGGQAPSAPKRLIPGTPLSRLRGTYDHTTPTGTTTINFGASAIISSPAVSALGGAGAVSALAQVNVPAKSALTGAGAVGAAAFINSPSLASLAGSGAMGAAALVVSIDYAQLGSSSIINFGAVAQMVSIASAASLGAGALAGSALVATPLAAALMGAGVIGARSQPATLTMAAMFELEALGGTALITSEALAALLGSGALGASASLSSIIEAALLGAGVTAGKAASSSIALAGILPFMFAGTPGALTTLGTAAVSPGSPALGGAAIITTQATAEIDGIYITPTVSPQYAGFVCGFADSILAQFVWCDAYYGTVGNTRSAPWQFIAYLIPERGMRQSTYRSNGRWWLRSGCAAAVQTAGNIRMRFAGGAQAKSPVYASLVDGSALSGYAANAEQTQWTVVTNCMPGGQAIISTWVNFS